MARLDDDDDALVVRGTVPESTDDKSDCIHISKNDDWLVHRDVMLCTVPGPGPLLLLRPLVSSLQAIHSHAEGLL